jgi:sugar O-acyltransferase (sialic acid O-acetyltransferase NeuD family)
MSSAYLSRESLMASKVVIFGTGDFARTASVYLARDSSYEVAGFTVHRQYRDADMLLGKPVFPFEDLPQLCPAGDHAMFVAIGFRGLNKLRASICASCKDKGYRLISYLSSRAVNLGDVELGENCFVFENNVLQPFARIGNNVILWSGNHIGHDAVIGDHCFITSHVVVSGNAKIGPYCFLGVNATVRDGVSVGTESVIGAGALVLKDVPPQSVLKGAATAISPVPSSRLKAI